MMDGNDWIIKGRFFVGGIQASIFKQLRVCSREGDLWKSRWVRFFQCLVFRSFGELCGGFGQEVLGVFQSFWGAVFEDFVQGLFFELITLILMVYSWIFLNFGLFVRVMFQLEVFSEGFVGFRIQVFLLRVISAIVRLASYLFLVIRKARGRFLKVFVLGEVRRRLRLIQKREL